MDDNVMGSYRAKGLPKGENLGEDQPFWDFTLGSTVVAL